jgi:HSP20 family protein
MKGNKMSSLVKYNRGVPSIFNRDEFLTPFSSIFDDVFNDITTGLDVGFFGKGAYPKVDVIDEDNQVIINAEVPGLSKDQVSVVIDDGVLQIKGEKKEETEDKSKRYVHRELKHSSFCRSFSIGENINKETVDAKFENGILTVTLKKTVPTPKAEPKKIEVK